MVVGSLKLNSRTVSRIGTPLISSVLLLVLIGVSHSDTADFPNFPATRLTIFDGETRRIIGHAEYGVSTSGDTEILRGLSSYFDGQRDVEVERLRLSSSEQAPTLVTYEHTFFNGDGSRQRRMSLDVESGTGSCEVDVNGKIEDRRSKMAVPEDTYAGAAQVLFLVVRLRQSADDVEFHSFDCIPEPKIVAIKATARIHRTRWSMYPGELLMLELKPDFGWLDFFIERLISKIQAWFDPSDNWNYVGGFYDRFYKGPHLLSVRDPPHRYGRVNHLEVLEGIGNSARRCGASGTNHCRFGRSASKLRGSNASQNLALSDRPPVMLPRR